MKHIVIGTAGHVDHGKTTLVRCITGHNTDRLKEEISRGITIELGFAPFTLPDGRRVSIVDVPGHERFIKNMLAGATGIDLVLFIIAADEGVMPQTREHMDILRLLAVDRGVVVLTKIDTVDDEWLELVREDVREYLADSPLNGAPVVEVSSVTNRGVPELLDAITNLCEQIRERPSTGICRLAIDRVFTMVGFGTVVTGTLWGGVIRQGDTLELLPARKQVRVRSIQVHGEKRDIAYAGQRVAVNLIGVEKAFAERGSWLATPGALRESRRIDIRFELLRDAPEMASNSRVHVHHGTTEVLARVKLLDKTALSPGESCFAQLELEEPLAALPGDRVVLRFYSPMFTIGGGVVLDAAAARQKRKNIDGELLRLTALHSGDVGQILLASMNKDGKLWQVRDIEACLQIGEQEATEVAREMTESGQIVALPDGYLIPTEAYYAICEKLAEWLEDYFKKWPMRSGAPRQEVAQNLFAKMDAKQQRALFQHLGEVGAFEQDEKTIRPSGWVSVITGENEAIIAAVRALFAKAPFMPPSWSETVEALRIPSKEQGEFLSWFLREGEMIRVSEDAVYMRVALDNAEAELRENYQGGFSLGEARDLLETNRKSAQQICEYFDAVKLTHWDGDKHFWN